MIDYLHNHPIEFDNLIELSLYGKKTAFLAWYVVTLQCNER